MLPQPLVDAARRRVLLQVEDRRRALAIGFRDIKSQSAVRGALGSSSVRVQTRNLVQQEYRIRAQIAWQAWQEALATQPTVPLADLRDTLVGEIRRCLEVESQDVQDIYAQAIQVSNSRGLNPSEELAEFRAEALERAASSIDYAILAATSREPAGAKEVTFHFHGPVGAVQTGHGSIAAVVQNFGSTERVALLGALEAVEREVVPAMPAPEQVQVVEVIADVRAEAKKERPNALKLRAGLSAIATTIQTLGSATSAYALLKGAAALVGLHLP